MCTSSYAKESIPLLYTPVEWHIVKLWTLHLINDAINWTWYWFNVANNSAFLTELQSCLASKCWVSWFLKYDNYFVLLWVLHKLEQLFVTGLYVITYILIQGYPYTGMVYKSRALSSVCYELLIPGGLRKQPPGCNIGGYLVLNNKLTMSHTRSPVKHGTASCRIPVWSCQ